MRDIESRAQSGRGKRMAAEGKTSPNITLADVCQAIADGRVPCTISGGHYEVRAADLRRIFRPEPDLRASRRVRPTSGIPASLLDSPRTGQLDIGA